MRLAAAAPSRTLKNLFQEGGVPPWERYFFRITGPAVDFALPSDELVQGTALIASTAVGESAQESASIGGSTDL